METVLVIVPCGKQKIWDAEPHYGPSRAADAYTGTLFTLNCAYAENFGNAWVVLSARYGFIEPDFWIPGPYDVTFNQKSTGSMGSEALQRQVEDLQLARYGIVAGLGGVRYRDVITAAFAGSAVRLVFPFEGLTIGRMLQATKRALENGDPGFQREDLG